MLLWCNCVLHKCMWVGICEDIFPADCGRRAEPMYDSLSLDKLRTPWKIIHPLIFFSFSIKYTLDVSYACFSDPIIGLL